MDTQIELSDKLRWEEFRKIVDKVPLQCFYQLLNNDSYTSSGYSFYIKSPGQGILLDPNIWIKYTIQLIDTVNNVLSNPFQTVGNDGAYGRILPASNARFAFRGGNVMQRATQNMIVIINGHSITCEPWKFVDVLNRLYISDDQSRHEFSGSGGKFDCGNHSIRTSGDISMVGATAAIGGGNTLGIEIIPGFHTNATLTNPAIVADTQGRIIFPCPQNDYFYNPGYNDRFSKFASLIRGHRPADSAPGTQYSANAAGLNTYTFEIYERLPIPPFKMYSNDEVYGMIPNIKDLTIRGQFCTNILRNILRATTEVGYTLNIPNSTTNCQLLIKWFTPPPEISVPRSVVMPLRKINVWSINNDVTALAPADNGPQVGTINQYNISLDAIPDLLLIYVKYRMDSAIISYPDDAMLELDNLQLNIEGASGKLNQIKTIQLYDNWKRLLKHQDPNISTYDEWRKYMCVAALVPSDYGCINGPGYSNPVTLGVTCNLKNWWNIPSTAGIAEDSYAGVAYELVVTSIYDKWSLSINESGSASSSLERVPPPNYASSASYGLSQLAPVPSTLRNII